MHFLDKILARVVKPFHSDPAFTDRFTLRGATSYDIRHFPRLSQLLPKSYFALHAQDKMALNVMEDHRGIPLFGVLFWKADLLYPYLRLESNQMQDVLYFFEYGPLCKRGKYFSFFHQMCAEAHFRLKTSRLLLLEDRLTRKEKRALLKLGYKIAEKGIAFKDRRYDLYAIEQLKKSW